MIYYIYNYRDKKLGCFDAPICTTEDLLTYKSHVERTLKKAKPIDYQFAKDKSLYFFGTFDDEAGSFNLKQNPDKLLDADEVLAPFDVIVKEYEALNVRDEQNDAIVARYNFNIEVERLKAQKKKEGVERA